MLGRHLTTEQIKSVANLGPLLPQTAFNDMKWLNGLDAKTFKIVGVDADDCGSKADSCPEGTEGLPPDQQSVLKNGQQLFRVQKESSDYRFCFDEDQREAANPHPKVIPEGEVPSAIATAPLPDALLCRRRLPADYKPPKGSKRAKSFVLPLVPNPNKVGEKFTLQIQPRSTEGVIYFLGEISRCQMGLDPKSVCIRPTIHVPYRGPGEPDEDVLFSIERTKAFGTLSSESQNGAIEADWGEYRYRVTMDPKALDRSGQTLRILTQLLALNRSAKDFPAPAIVPIISR
jgi:hypothetical protein